ncbi:hypothetical protein Mal48_22140 [Thalassoglobus polymorphus]|uniref:Uncharacterized protein n=1 Tax=Thalassoglobus polymorphus TaxID=2527994 RepID=A0A517QN02_9PLAN|nr:hypothetical protein Mal48_22140 [Thalassoglobus polymorphus]
MINRLELVLKPDIALSNVEKSGYPRGFRTGSSNGTSAFCNSLPHSHSFAKYNSRQFIRDSKITKPFCPHPSPPSCTTEVFDANEYQEQTLFRDFLRASSCEQIEPDLA